MKRLTGLAAAVVVMSCSAIDFAWSGEASTDDLVPDNEEQLRDRFLHAATCETLILMYHRNPAVRALQGVNVEPTRKHKLFFSVWIALMGASENFPTNELRDLLDAGTQRGKQALEEGHFAEVLAMCLETADRMKEPLMRYGTTQEGD